MFHNEINTEIKGIDSLNVAYDMSEYIEINKRSTKIIVNYAANNLIDITKLVSLSQTNKETKFVLRIMEAT